MAAYLSVVAKCTTWHVTKIKEFANSGNTPKSCGLWEAADQDCKI